MKQPFKTETAIAVVVGIVLVILALGALNKGKGNPVAGYENSYFSNVTNTNVNVGTVSKRILTARGSRLNTMISECSGYNHWISLEDGAAVGKGILLTASATMRDFIGPDNPFTGNVYAISSNVAGRLCITDY